MHSVAPFVKRFDGQSCLSQQAKPVDVVLALGSTGTAFEMILVVVAVVAFVASVVDGFEDVGIVHFFVVLLVVTVHVALHAAFVVCDDHVVAIAGNVLEHVVVIAVANDLESVDALVIVIA